MQIHTLKSQPRKAAGSRAAARLRRGGKLPAIVYGHKQDPIPVALNHHDVELQLEHGAHLINLDLDGTVQPCLIKDAQYDHLGAKLIHVDLTRVDLTERVKVHVPIELRGHPKGVSKGGVLRLELPELEVECRVTDIPEVIRLDVSDLDLDEVMFVKDLTLEAGLTAANDPETVVVTVREPTVKAEEVVEAAATEGSTEPEVISKGKDEEEQAGEPNK